MSYPTRRRPVWIVTAIFLGATTALPAVAQEDQEDIVIGHYRKIHSRILDEGRTLLVNLPRGYDETAIGYPVIYILYGGQVRNYFAEALYITTLLGTTRMPPVILVGITNTERYRDYLPLDREGNPAGADRFLRFMVEEAMPFVEANYRTADFRILVGPQAGGTFGLYTLTERPETFDAYILNNPFRYLVQRDYLIEKVETFLAGRETLKVFLYVNAEDSDFPEALEYMPRLEEVVSAKAPAEFEWKIEVVEENGDFLQPSGLREGLTLVFSPYEFPAGVGSVSLADIEAYYTELSERYGYEVAIPDMVLAMQSDNLAQAGRVEEAIEMLERLVELYPHSLNGWWRLAGIYRERGEIDRALHYYRKCLEVDPDMVYAQQMIERLERERD
ncbi:MAG: tetratricopeptide repeat protein [Gemmatimonadota bacterium]|nr:MAG: tetratricopeptide repeat protein [Gemmatimonadota bacterium]